MTLRYMIATLALGVLTTGWLAAQTVEVTVAPSPKLPVSISGNTEICKGSETTLKVEGDFESFEWNDGTKDRYLKVREEGVYEVTVKTKAGCTYTSSVNVRLRPCT
jgi:hypothetical protein